MLGGSELLDVSMGYMADDFQSDNAGKNQGGYNILARTISPMDKFVYALNMNRLKEYSTKNLGEAHQKDRYPAKNNADVAYSLTEK